MTQVDKLLGKYGHLSMASQEDSLEKTATYLAHPPPQ